MRKNTASSALLDSTLRIHEGSSASAESAATTANPNAASSIESRRVLGDDCCEGSRKHFNGHLLGGDIVGNIFGGHSQLVIAGNRLVGNKQLPGTRAGLRVPMQFDRSRSIEPGQQGARTRGGTHVESHGFAALETL